MGAAIDSKGRRIERASRRVDPHEVLLVTVVADRTHERLVTVARRGGMTVEELTAKVLGRLADDLGS